MICSAAFCDLPGIFINIIISWSEGANIAWYNSDFLMFCGGKLLVSFEDG